MEQSETISRILVCYHNKRVLDLLHKSFKNLDCKVIERQFDNIDNKTELINEVCLNHPDVTIIDFQTPNQGLVHLHRDLHSKNEKLILMVTTHNAPKSTIRVFDLNTEGYLTEPLKPSDLKEWLKVELLVNRNKQAK